MPHLDAAYNLARWLTRREHDAQDVVQEAYLRAFKAFAQFHGASDGREARCWLLAIVRNTCFTWLGRNRPAEAVPALDDAEDPAVAGSEAWDPSVILQQTEDRMMVRQAIETLPAPFREAIVLREFENLSYQEIATIAGVP